MPLAFLCELTATQETLSRGCREGRGESQRAQRAASPALISALATVAVNCHRTFSASPLQKAGTGLCARFQGRAVEAADVSLVPRSSGRCRRTEQPGRIRARVQKSFTAKGGPTVPTAATVPPPASGGSQQSPAWDWALASSPGRSPRPLSGLARAGASPPGSPGAVSAALVNSSAQAREPRPGGLRNLGDPEPAPTRLGPPGGRPGLRGRVGQPPSPHPHPHTHVWEV